MCGARNSAKTAAFPRMHNKFLVFCKAAVTNDESTYETYDPYAVWTGSFNLTRNASNSLENAVLIRDEEISTAFLEEFGLIFGLSESSIGTSHGVLPNIALAHRPIVRVF